MNDTERAQWREELARMILGAHELYYATNLGMEPMLWDDVERADHQAALKMAEAAESAVHTRLAPRLEHVRGLMEAGETPEALRAITKLQIEVES